MQRSAIVTLHHVGLSVTQIAQMTLCSAPTIRRWINRFVECNSLSDAQRSGRPNVTSDTNVQSIVSLAEEERFITPKQIKAEFRMSVSTRTVRRRLNEVGLFGRMARVSYPFTQEHIDKRLAFVESYGEWDETKWDTVLFSDETHIYVGGEGQVWVQRPEDAALVADYMVDRTAHPEKISVWGCFSAKGIGVFRVFDDALDTRMLTDILRRDMKPHALSVWPLGQWFFLQDNAPAHSSNETKRFLHTNGIDCIVFPPHSPDLNPIENLWAHLKRRIENRFPTNREELTRTFIEEWQVTDPTLLANLAHSMIHRCKAVTACRGFKTKY
jgi:transposase